MTYIDGVVIPVGRDVSEQSYADFAREAGQIFRDHGAIRVVDAWGDDVPDGTLTDFRRAVAATEGETVVFSWIEWPDRAARDAGMKAAMDDPRMRVTTDIPFDGKRMIFGGFRVIADA